MYPVVKSVLAFDVFFLIKYLVFTRRSPFWRQVFFHSVSSFRPRVLLPGRACRAFLRMGSKKVWRPTLTLFFQSSGVFGGHCYLFADPALTMWHVLGISVGVDLAGSPRGNEANSCLIHSTCISTTLVLGTSIPGTRYTF